MKKLLDRIRYGKAAIDVLREQNFEALRLAAEHCAAAEHHAALAAMYEARALRTGLAFEKTRSEVPA